MGRCKNGEAISPAGRSAAARKTLRRFLDEVRSQNDLDVWRRARGVLGYIEGRRVVDLAAELDVTRGSVNRWLQWYDALGVDGLVTGIPPGPAPKLSKAHRDELATLIESGPSAAGYTSGVWTGPMIGDLIAQRVPRYRSRFHQTLTGLIERHPCPRDGRATRPPVGQHNVTVQ